MRFLHSCAPHPIVMNTDEELRAAFEELENQTFVKSR